MNESSSIYILTMLPQLFTPFFDVGVTGQTFSNKRGHDFYFEVLNLSDFSPKNFKGVDDAPYGGGQGMVMRADVLKAALDHIKNNRKTSNPLCVIYTGPRGIAWNNDVCKAFAKDKWGATKKDLVFLCGRYEGVDERFLEKYVDEVYSLGDYVLTGGDLAVMVMLDSAIRFVKGTLGSDLSADEDSFNDGLLEYPQYTRPSDFEGVKPPAVLLSGDHAKIKKFRLEEKLRITKEIRPDLYERYMNGEKK